jgi:hypothetical protein
VGRVDDPGLVSSVCGACSVFPTLLVTADEFVSVAEKDVLFTLPTNRHFRLLVTHLYPPL